MSPPELTGLPVLPTDLLKIDHVLLQDVYRQLGINYGDRVFARIMDADDPDSEKPLENITWQKLLIDVIKVAGVLREQIGGGIGVKEGEKLTYALLANSSYAYYVNTVAAWFNDWSVLLLSTRNSVAGIVSLMGAVGAKALLADGRNFKAAEAVVQELGTPIKFLTMVDPDGIDMEVKLPTGPIEVSSVSSEEFKKTALYLHTSGTSSYPKPISHTHEHFVREIMIARLNKNYPGAPLYSPLPLFHAAGWFAHTRWSIGSGLIVTFIHAKLPLTSTSVLRHLKRLPGAVCLLAPVLLEDTLREPPETLEVLKTTKRLFYGGAPIDKRASKRLLGMGVPVINLYGATELIMPCITDFPGPPESRVEDGSYVRFFEEHYGIHWKPFNGNVKELVVCPGKTGITAVLNHENPVGYATSDLWEPHPNLPGLFKHCGRKDSVTVLSNGEKTDNRQIELLLMDDHLINGVVVFGAGRSLNGVLICKDPSAENLSAEDFINAIWSTIEHVNTVVPNHSRIIKQMVIIADAHNKPFMRTDKNTIKTKGTLELYKEEIDAAYDSLETETESEAVQGVNGPEEIVEYVRGVVSKVAERPFGDNDDFFENGLDSLHSVQIRTEIKPLFAKFIKGEELPHNIAYSYPTISRLSTYLISGSKGEHLSPDDPAAVVSRIRTYVERWSASLPKRRMSTASEPERKVFALTGSTGSLGVHTLRSLLERDDVEKVYCLHRGTADVAVQRHKKLFQDRSLPISLLDSGKVSFVQVDLSKPDLGLSKAKYDKLRNSLTHIVHAAWELNFNWGIERFERVHIAGVRHLIDLSIASTLPRSPRVVFISSIGTVSKRSSDAPVPEEPLDDPSLIGARGYGESKFVSEHVLNKAATFSGVPVTVIRSGQISGSSIDGYWAPTEYIPTIFRSSKMLGKVPNKLPDTRWLPADNCGRAVVDFALQNEEYLQYYHLENPTSTPWDTIVNLFTNASEAKIEAVDNQEWLAAVEKASKDGTGIPAAPLLQFYSEYSSSSSFVYLGTAKSGKASQAISYGPVTSDLVSKYISWI
ncbi:acetyl-CoA synthetase-like protein [Macrolepiota fuliginosa MF-IS2]|uniref:Acetyl-CoA synthetase-like protein n=1 Tax=Macrolepiota fuliginosa MF-IS2 TaxID=1400762 RepID=A0A9P5X807_9AGAR|nr:acetyl-CoA synthetase-like protein [Macrolepiota fuliginosa MF-IS2]